MQIIYSVIKLRDEEWVFRKDVVQRYERNGIFHYLDYGDWWQSHR
jgi:hypothetical protein